MMPTRDQHSPSAEKPYGFVPITPLGLGDREWPVGHDQYHADTVSGWLEATLIVATPLHVSSGRIRMQPDRDPPLVREITRINGRPCIPATTLKGVVRSVVEAITLSCLRIADVHRRGSKWHKYGMRYPPLTEGCSDPKELCIACRLFGALGFEGHVRFGDAVLQPEQESRVGIVRMPALWEPARKGADPYVRAGLPSGRKFYKHGRPAVQARTPVEVLAPEASLGCDIHFENLEPGQLGVLLTAMGLDERYSLTLKIGGGKPACYGSAMVRLDRLSIWENTQAPYASYDAQITHRMPKEYLDAAAGLVLTEALRRLAVLWAYTPRRQCPEGNY